MASRKIKLKDQLGRVIVLPKERPVPPAPPVVTPPPAGPAATVWKLIREIPKNIQKLAALGGEGFTTRGSTGDWYQRSIAGTAGQVEVNDGDGVDGNPTISLADVADAGGGTLQRTAFDTKGRKTGTSAATTTHLGEGDNLYFTNARADARIEAGAAIMDIMLLPEAEL